MKIISKFLIIAIWIALIYILARLNLLSGDMDNLKLVFKRWDDFKEVIFIALSSLRIVALIPSTVFIILGGMLFNPIEAIILTVISIIISETIVYIISKVVVSSAIQNYLVNKYPRLYEVLLKNNIKILSIGIICPVAPSDVICFLASSTGLNYRKFILIVILANLPMTILYSFFGSGIMSSANNTIIIAVSILIISIYSLYLWRKAQRSND